MAVIKSFRAFRPTTENQAKIPALPYDVMSSEEARELAQDNPLSFLHVDKPEIDLPIGTDLYDDKVYAKAGENLNALIAGRSLLQDPKNSLYLYRQVWRGRAQTGLVCCAAIDDYLNHTIKQHEHTRSDKEADRVRHVDACNANTGPIFLTYRYQAEITQLQNAWIAGHKPVYNFITSDGVTQQVWLIDDEAIQAKLIARFSSIESLYIADGHHRCAAAVKVGQNRRAANPFYSGKEAFNYFLAIVFADNELEILDYNRVVADLNGLSSPDFINELSKSFIVEEKGEAPYKPANQHTFGMYLDEKWYALRAKDGSFNRADPVAKLDVSILQNNLLSPVLGIGDPKTDQRIDFVGGIRGLEELEKRVKGGMRVAFALCPTTVEELMAIADDEQIMPPKSTWFEPKLLSGLFIHSLDDKRA